MGALWRWISLRHLFQERGRTLLTLLGVALGVAVFVSIRLANHSAMASFAETVDSVAGKANLQISADSNGFDETIYPKVRAVDGVQAISPLVMTHAIATFGEPEQPRTYRSYETSKQNDTLLLLGVDIFSENMFGRLEPPSARERLRWLHFLTNPKAVAITPELAQRRGLKVGDELHLILGGRPFTAYVQIVLADSTMQQAMGGNIVLMDIGAAQEALQRFGKLDRIDMVVEPGDMDRVKAALEPLLPPGAQLGQPRGRTQQVENLVRAFDLNLTALSFIALFVSMFLIFNSVSMSVVRRRREIGILRALGTTRRQVLTLILAEAMFVGVAGSAIGLVLGTGLAKLALGAVSRTISALYLLVHAENVQFDVSTYVMSFCIGVGVSLLSALAPAIEASKTSPNVTVRQGAFLEVQQLPVRRWTATGYALLVASAVVVWWTVTQRQPLGGFIGSFFLLSGFCFLAPGFTLISERCATPVLHRVAGIEGLLGGRYIREAVARTSVVVAALMVSVGMMIGLAIMVGSFRRSVETWVNQTLRADLYIEAVGRTVTGSATSLPPEIERAARSLDGVQAVDTLRVVQIQYRDKLAQLVAIDFATQRDHGYFQFMRGHTRDIMERGLKEEGVIVTESFAFRHRVREGDRITLDTPSGPATFPVVGVYYDYSTDAGALMMDWHVFQRLWNDSRTESVALYLKPGVDVDQIREEFVRQAGTDTLLYITPTRDLRKRVLVVFDQTFQITYALQTIAIVVAVLGVITTLTALIMQRAREIGVLRGVGALRGQVRKMVLVESGLLGLIGSILGCACGVALAYLLIYVINKQFFGWSFRMVLEPGIFLQAVGLMVVTALVAGLQPARLAAGRVAAEAMRGD